MADFYLISGDSTPNARPHACKLIRRVTTARGNDSVVVELSPPLPGPLYHSTQDEISFVVLSPRWEGGSFDGDHKWPVIVNVVEPLVDRPEDVVALEESQFRIVDWAAVYPSEEAAYRQ